MSGSEKLIKVGDDYVYNERNMLGKGSFGEVYEGRSRVDNKKVAIKKIYFPAEDIEAQSSVRKELELMRARKHPNVMGFITDIRNGSYLLIVMKLCDGNLAELLNVVGGKFQAPDQIQGLVSQITAGYEALYYAKILHRDIKPQNILFTLSSNYQVTLKLADLGCGRMLGNRSAQANSVCGTPRYLAPEILQIYLTGQGHYDARADLWSIGLVFCEIADGHLPVTANFFIKLSQGIPKPLAEIIDKMLKHHDQRMLPEDLFSHAYIRSGSGIPVVIPDGKKIISKRGSQAAMTDSGMSSKKSSSSKTSKDSGFYTGPTAHYSQYSTASSKIIIRDHASFIAHLKAQGCIQSESVEAAMLAVDLKNFYHNDPYRDIQHEIPGERRATAPSMVAYVLEQIKDHLRPGTRVLNVFCDAGYMAACIAVLLGPSGVVIGVDNVPELVRTAVHNISKGNISLLNNKRVLLTIDNPINGHEHLAPYGVVFLDSTLPVPQTIVNQLAAGGRLVTFTKRENGELVCRVMDAESKNGTMKTGRK